MKSKLILPLAAALAIAGGASPLEAAIISNHAAGIVVGKVIKCRKIFTR